MTEDTCPMDGCEAPYSKKIETISPFKQSPLKMTCAQVCVVPTAIDGKAGNILVYHTYEDLAEVEDDDSSPKSPADISENHRIVHEIVAAASRGEMLGDNHSALHGRVRKAAVEHGVPKNDVKSILVNLVYHGFIDEIENSVFQVPSEVPE